VTEYYDFCFVNKEKEVCREIGARLKNLRIKNGYSSYENFAVENDLSRMQYWRIEKGLTNLTIRSLVTLLNIHKISIKDFFNSDGFKADGKAKEVKTFKLDGKTHRLVKSFELDGHAKQDGHKKKK
jgi:transcriptional regulator with XRE-family HTH domain